jgi:methyltransferase (TIGR00027 family)
MKKRIESKTSRTAEMTCLTRAASSLESDDHYHSGDHLAVSLLPDFLRALIHIPLCRKLFVRILAPRGVYEYVIARTKYVDAVFEKALVERFDQIIVFGAGFDTRALRLYCKTGCTLIFELDSPITQQAKIHQYKKRNLSVPSNVVFIAIDFEKEPLSQKLNMAEFKKDKRTLFILEGLLMYLDPKSVKSTFQTIQEYAGKGSRVVFDYIQASVLRHENKLYGESGLAKTVSKAGEQWQFGIEPDEIASFAATYSLEVSDHKCAQELEADYFKDEHSRLVGRINGTHCIVTMEKRPVNHGA